MGLTVLSGEESLQREIRGAYASDLLSDVMAHSQEGMVWITLQDHTTALAVAILKRLAAMILVQGLQPDAAMLKKAEEEGFPILGTPEGSFETSGKLYALLQQESAKRGY